MQDVVTQQIPVAPGKFEAIIAWIKAMWDKIDIKKWSEEIGGSSSMAVQAAIYFGLGFAFGFLFKKYFKFIFFTLLFAMVIVLVLEYNNVIAIDWKALNIFLGLDPSTDFGVLINNVFEWIKQNLVIFISGTVGFIIGYKLG